MPLQVVQCVAKNLMTSMRIAGVNVVNCGIEWVTSFSTFNRRTLFHVEDHVNSRKSTFTFLFDKDAMKF